MGAPPFFVADLFDVLFKPSPAVRDEMRFLQDELGGIIDGNFIAIHIRTGSIAYDPERHGPEEISNFIDCAHRVEADLAHEISSDSGTRALGDSSLPWFLATDSAQVAEAATALPETVSGKLRIPSFRGRIHIDRFELGDVLQGATANYAEWLLFGRAAAVVLSRSFFGETA